MKLINWFKNRFLIHDYSKEYYEMELYLAKGRENYWENEYLKLRERFKNEIRL